MIDKLNGSINFDDGKYILNHNITVEDFKKLGFYESGSLTPRYSLKSPQIISQKLFRITVYFENNFIKEIHLTEYISGMSWGEWTEENELKKKAHHDEWLHSQLGEGPYDYSWGTVESTFDPKGLVSSIIIRYK